jgi:flagellin
MNGAGALAGIEKIKQGIEINSRERSNLGAVQNRIGHMINNLDNVVENTTAAESRLRDTDMADEITHNSNTELLAQAGQMILAQANQSKQGVLNLLQ